MSTRKLHPKERYFRYLTRLSRGGRSNMYGAVPYLATAFGLDREAAFHVVCEWVDAHQAAQAAAAASLGAARVSPPASAQPSAPVASPRSRAQPMEAVGRKPVAAKRKRAGARRSGVRRSGVRRAA
jgi:hypothetical protein